MLRSFGTSKVFWKTLRMELNTRVENQRKPIAEKSVTDPLTRAISRTVSRTLCPAPQLDDGSNRSRNAIAALAALSGVLPRKKIDVETSSRMNGTTASSRLNATPDARNITSSSPRLRQSNQENRFARTPSGTITTGAADGVAANAGVPRSRRRTFRGSIMRAAATACAASDALEHVPRALADRIAGVERRRRLEEHHLAVLSRHGPVLDTAWHDEHIACAQQQRSITELHRELTTMHEKELVLVGMRVPVECALNPDELDLLPVQLCNHARIPVIRDRGELLVEGNTIGHGDTTAQGDDEIRKSCEASATRTVDGGQAPARPTG